MNQTKQKLGCPFLRELLNVLGSKQPSWPFSEQESLFRRLLDLERRAHQAAALTTSIEAIASIRRLAAISAAGAEPARIRGH